MRTLRHEAGGMAKLFTFFVHAALAVGMLSFGAAGAVVMPPIACPQKMSVGQVHTCFFSALDLDGVITIDLVKPGSDEVLVSAVEGRSRSVLQIVVPVDIEPGIVEVRATLTSDEGSASTMAEIEVMHEPVLVMLEMDKAVYKPGQTARFRALVLRIVDLVPVEGKEVELLLSEWGGTHLFKQVVYSDAFGVARFEYPIADELALGVHQARALVLNTEGAGGSHAVYFNIAEHELPRFDTILTLDAHNVFSADPSRFEISGRVGGVYTFGQPVDSAVVTVEVRWQELVLADIVVPPCERSLKGCPWSAVVVFPSYSGYTELMITARVEELSTGDVQTTGDTVTLVRDDPDHIHIGAWLETADGLDTFRPHLPVKVRVHVKDVFGEHKNVSDVIRREGLPYLWAYFKPLNENYPDQEQHFYEVTATEDVYEGLVEFQLPIVVENASCCDPLSQPQSAQEFFEKKGCCIDHVQVQVRGGGVGWFWDMDFDHLLRSFICLTRDYSATGHHMNVFLPEEGSQNARIQITADPEAELSETVEYIVMAQNSVLASSSGVFENVTWNPEGYYEALLEFDWNDATGDCKLLVMARTLAGAPVIGSARGWRNLALKYQLNASYSETEVRPGESVDVELSVRGLAAGARSRVFVATHDRATELMGMRSRIETQTIIETVKRSFIDDDTANIENIPWKECSMLQDYSMLLLGAVSPSIQVLGSSSDLVDVEDTPWGDPTYCPRQLPLTTCPVGLAQRREPLPMTSIPFEDPSALAPAPQVRAEVRRFFPEAWLWEETELVADSSGFASASSSFKAPETISSFPLEAFASTPQGIVTVRAEPLTVFKAFFAQLRLPPTAKRSELVQIDVILFNYIDGASVEVQGEVVLGEGLELEDGGRRLDFALEIGELGSSALKLFVRPSKLGDLPILVEANATTVIQPGEAGAPSFFADALERQLRVTPEGFLVRKTKNVILEGSSMGNTKDLTFYMKVPDTFVDDSVSAKFTFSADIMQPSLMNFDNLLMIPDGCGEQNAAALHMVVSVARYLNTVGRLHLGMKERILRYAISGYARQLKFRHPNGGFSAFGTQDDGACTWLTAFVLKLMSEIYSLEFITVDKHLIQVATEFLLATQMSDGSFEEVGDVIHVEMLLFDSRKEESARLSLTAFVIISLNMAKRLVPGLNVSGLDESLARAKAFLDRDAIVDANLTNYARNIMTAALLDSESSGYEELAKSMLNHSIFVDGGVEGTYRYWDHDTRLNFFQSLSGNIETSGFALLSLARAGYTEEAFQIARYLLNQRNPLGGFVSTPDSTVALAALSEFASQLAGSMPDIAVTLSGGGGLDETVTIDMSTLENPKTTKIPDPKVPLSMKSSGSGTAVAVLEVSYFSYKVESLHQPCYGLDIEWFAVGSDRLLIRACAEPQPWCLSATIGSSSAMWIMNIGLFTGSVPELASLKQLVEHKEIKRFEWEHGQENVFLYLTGRLEHGQRRCIEFNASIDYNVSSHRPVPSSIFEYYTPENQGLVLTEYSPTEEYYPAGDSGTSNFDSWLLGVDDSISALQSEPDDSDLHENDTLDDRAVEEEEELTTNTTDEIPKDPMRQPTNGSPSRRASDVLPALLLALLAAAPAAAAA